MQAILGAMTKSEIRKSLRNLSADLGQAFEDTIQRIEREPRNRQQVAMQTLVWLSHACRPLQINHLLYALATQVGDTVFDRDNLLQPRLIVESCFGLVVIDEESSNVRLVHYTLQDYLRSRHEGFLTQEQTYLTQICLTYLFFDEPKTSDVSPRSCRQKRDDNTKAFQFLDYAAAHWGHHALLASNEVNELALRFLRNPSKIARAAHWQTRSFIQPYALWRHGESGENHNRRNVTGSHLVAFFGLTELAILLFNEGSDVHATDSYGNTPLHEAAANGQLSMANVLLERYTEVDEVNTDFNTPLYLTVSSGHGDLALALLKHGADPNVQCIDDWTPLHKAADNGNVAIVKLLLDHGASIYSKSARGLTALHRASGRGHIETVRLLLALGSPVNATTWDGWTPLHGASSSGQHEAVRLLIEQSAGIDSRSDDQRTALHRACRGGYYQTVKVLLDSGADLFITDSGDNTSLHRAAKGGHRKVAQLLLDHDPTSRKIQLSAVNSCGRTARQEASYTGNWKMAAILREAECRTQGSNPEQRNDLETAIEEHSLPKVMELLAQGVDVNRWSSDGLTPLHQALLLGDKSIARVLLESKADLKAKTTDGWEPLHCAAKKGMESAVRFCLDHEANIAARTTDGQTALHKVCKSGSVETTTLLLERGANIEAQDDWSWRPLHTAAAAGSKDIVDLLIAHGADMEARDREGRSVQACAARAGHHNLVEYFRQERSYDLGAL